MRALAIIGAIVSAWISGVGANSADRHHFGALLFLILAVLCGVVAWLS